LFEISILVLIIAILLIVSVYQNSFEKEIDLAVIFLFVALFLAAVSLARALKSVP